MNGGGFVNDSFDNYFAAVKNSFCDCADLITRVVGKSGARFALLFIKGITSREYVSEMVLRPLLRAELSGFSGDFAGLLESVSLSVPSDCALACDSVAKGEALVMVESANGFYCVLANIQAGPSRSVQEPTSDVTVRGPKAGFVEDAETNMALLRKYIRTSSLKFRQFAVGSVSSTRVVLGYVEGRADKKLVEDIAQRISALNASVITDSANLSMLLTGKRDRLLPTCGSTEKVDKAASKLMSGRIAVIVDGSPFVLTLPFVFAESIQASDDYLHTPYYATFIRMLRFTAFVAAIFAPAVLCAAVNYDPSKLPEELYGIIAESRKDIPLSFFWEISAILLLFELLREVGVRMPRTVGDAVGIVGSIILGNTAVEAGIVSSVGVITVAFSAVCAFITPSYMYVIVLLRLAVLVLAEMFGLYGIGFGVAAFLFLLCGKESFGVPYMSPIAPFDIKGMQDFIFCWPKKTLGRKERLGERN